MQPSAPTDRVGPPLAPAPWALRAEGYLLALKLAPTRERGALFVSDELAEPHLGPLGWVMYVDYSETPVGPYRELLFIPGSFRFGSRRLFSVTKIYVSTQASVDNGRRNWGIPKELASFEVERRGKRVEQLRVRMGSAPVAELTLRHGTLPLPFTSALVPPRLRTLGQRLAGTSFEVTPSARGTLQRTAVEQAWSDSALFAPLTTRSILAAFRLSNVSLTFPEAKIGRAPPTT